MSRELERRLVALERATGPDRARYLVFDRPPEDGDDASGLSPVMTEAEWIEAYGNREEQVTEFFIAAFSGPIQPTSRKSLRPCPR